MAAILLDSTHIEKVKHVQKTVIEGQPFRSALLQESAAEVLDTTFGPLMLPESHDILEKPLEPEIAEPTQGQNLLAHSHQWHGLPTREPSTPDSQSAPQGQDAPATHNHPEWHGLPAHSNQWHELPAREPSTPDSQSAPQGQDAPATHNHPEWHGLPAHSNQWHGLPAREPITPEAQPHDPEPPLPKWIPAATPRQIINGAARDLADLVSLLIARQKVSVGFAADHKTISEVRQLTRSLRELHHIVRETDRRKPGPKPKSALKER